jgi:hypothetical protein
VNLDHTPVDDSGLGDAHPLEHEPCCASIRSGLPFVRRGEIGHTAVTDNGIPHLANLSQLSALELQGTVVSDHGIESRAALTTLSELRVFDTKISKQSAAALRARLPACRIRD